MSRKKSLNKALIYITLVMMLFSIFPVSSFAAEGEQHVVEVMEETITNPVEELLEEEMSEELIADKDEDETFAEINNEAMNVSNLMLLNDTMMRTMNLKFENNLQDAELPLVSYTAYGQLDYGAGKYGRALNMKQNKMKVVEPRVSLGNVEYGVDQDFTIAFWFHADRVNNNVDSIVLANKDYTNWYRPGWVFTAHNRFTGQSSGSGDIDLAFNYQTKDSPTAANNRIMEPFKGSMDGQWHHIAVSVTRGQTIETFMDGKSLNVLDLSELGQPFTTIDVGLPTHIGATGTGEQEKNSQFMMDDLYIIPQALTETEITELMQDSVVESVFDHTLLAMKFDENAVDHSEYARNVQLFATPQYSIGQMGKSIRLGNYNDGTIKYADAGSIAYGSNNLSVGFWLKVNQVEDVQQLASILGNTTQGNTGWMFGIDENNTLQWTIKGDNSDQTQAVNVADVELGKWHHYTIVQDRTTATAKVYVDGSPVYEEPLTVQGIIDSEMYSTKLAVDGAGHLNASELDILLDELYIFEEVLSPSDVTTLYNMVPPMPGEEVTGALVLFGAEHSIKDSLMRMNLTSRFELPIERASTLHTTITYDPDKFEFIEAYAQDARQQIEVLNNDNGKLELKITGVIHKPSTHEFEYRESKIAILDFRTIAESGEGKVAIDEALFSDAAEAVFFDNATNFQLDEKLVQIHSKEELDFNQDGLITVSDIVVALQANVSQEVVEKIAEQSNIMPYKRVLFIGIDGAGNIVKGKDSPFWSSANQQVQPVGDLLHIPFIRSLIENGAASYDVRAVMPSSSTPNWVAMITGLDFANHEVDNWSSANNRYSSSSMYMDGHHVGTIHRTMNENWPQRRTAYFSVWFDAIYGHVEQYLGAELVRGLNNDDSYTLNNTLEFIRSGKLKDTSFIQVTFDETDTTGHSKGFYSKAYYEKMNLTDTRIKQVIDEIAEQGLLEDTLILMSADHGAGIPQPDGTIQNWTNHGYDNDLNRTVFLAANGRTVATAEVGEKLLQGGNTYDIYAIALAALGLEHDETRDAKVPEGLFLQQTELNNPEAANVQFYTMPDADNENVYKLTMNGLKPNTIVAEFELEAVGSTFEDISLEVEDGVDIIRFAEKPNGKLQLIVTKMNGFVDDEVVVFAHNVAGGKLEITQAMLADLRGQEFLPNLQQGEKPTPMNMSFIQAPITAKKGEMVELTIGLENPQVGLFGHEYILEYNPDAFELKAVTLSELLAASDAILRYNDADGKLHMLLTGNAKPLDQAGALITVQLQSIAETIGTVETLLLTGNVSDGTVKNPVHAAETEVELLGTATDKSALAQAIQEATAIYEAAEVGEESGQYPAEALEELQSILEEVTEVYDDIEATPKQINRAVSALNEAVERFKSKVIGKPVDDDIAPTWPTVSLLSASDITATTVTLIWTRATDNISVTKYKLSWNGGSTEVAGQLNTAKITHLQPGQTYTFKVEAADAANNWTTNGPSIEVVMLLSSGGGGGTYPGYIPPTDNGQEASEETEEAEGTEGTEGVEGTEDPEAVDGEGDSHEQEGAEGEASSFTDVTDHWARAAIKRATELNIINGYPNNTFRPNAAVTRAEFAVMLAKAFKWNVAGDATVFLDNEQIADWAAKAIAQAVELDIVKGYGDHTFRPNQQISRAEMALMLARAMDVQLDGAASATDFADDQEIPVWAKPAVTYLRNNSVIEGRSEHHFVPSGIATRAEAITIILRVIE